MLLMDYPFIREEDLPDFSNKFTWNLLYEYIDAHSQILIDEFPGDAVQAITRMQCQFENMKFA